MITKVIMPQMSLTMQFGVVSKWLKSQGESVIVGEPICTVEGDKAAVDIEAPATGILKKIIAQEGNEFPVKQTMAYIGDPSDVIGDDSIIDNPPSQNEGLDKGSNLPISEKIQSDNRVKASPMAKRLAEEKGVDLSKIRGTGPEGLIGKEDIMVFISASQAPLIDDEFRELNSIEKVIAEKMTQSNHEIPHFHLSTSCNLDKLNTLRKAANEKRSNTNHLSLTDLIIWSVSRSLRKYSLINTSYQSNKIIFHKNVNVGLAVNTPKGLLVVVIKDADSMTVNKIAETREDLTQRAKAGNQKPEDLSECTFTISNLGTFGIESFNPIITPGQVGILGVGSIVNSLELDNKGTVHSVERLTLTLGCDHRVINGVTGAEFLSSIRESLENPTGMF